MCVSHAKCVRECPCVVLEGCAVGGRGAGDAVGSQDRVGPCPCHGAIIIELGQHPVHVGTRQ